MRLVLDVPFPGVSSVAESVIGVEGEYDYF